MKIFFYGSYLPEIGGMSIHVSRLAELLNFEGLLGCVYSASKLNNKNTSLFIVKDVSYSKIKYGFIKSFIWFVIYGFKNRSSIIHLHVNPIWHSITIKLLLTFANRKIVCTIHDQMLIENIDKIPFLFSFTFKKLLGSKNIRWIVVNDTIKKQLQKLDFNCNRIYIIPAYLPAFSVTDIIVEEEIETFIQNKQEIITIYAATTALFRGKDLYGIGLAIMAINNIKKEFPSIGLIICIPGEMSAIQMNYYLKLINDFDLTDNVFFNLKPLKNTIGLLKKSHILLRPTLSDGDSLMVREALSVETFVVASDVVKRPDGVVLFQSENLNDLVIKLKEVLNNKNKIISAGTVQSENNYLLIKKVYELFINS
jgi:glycosyltransferase involved in cell wall biosynthesis